jgi:AraC-like DNA-binding protein
VRGSSGSGALVDAFARDFRPGDRIDDHAHESDQLLYASSGVMTLVTRAGVWVVPPHRGAWIPAGTAHRISMSGAVLMRTLYFRRGSAFGDASCRALNVRPLLRELILEVVRRAPEPPTAARTRLVAVLLDQLLAVPVLPLHLPEPRDPRARRVAAAIRRAPDDPRPQAELARWAGASTRTLSRLFLGETGMSLGVWRQQARMLAALERLAAGDPVTSVALQVGYESPSAFVAAFRRSLGTSPGRYFGDERPSMAVPRQRTSRARKRSARAHAKLAPARARKSER